MKSSVKFFLFSALVLAIIILNSQNYLGYDFLSTNEDQNSEYYLNPKTLVCEPFRQRILLIAFVILAPEHFEKRNAIRSTWGNKTLAPNDFRLIFTVGQSKNSTVNEKIVEEFKIHKDILQINNFTDSYFNMTTKIMKSFKWITQYCYSAQYVLRINDDVMVNTFSLIHYLKNITYRKNQLYGRLLRKTVPIRSIYHKHFVSVKQFPDSHYPDYPGIFPKKQIQINDTIFLKIKNKFKKDHIT